MKTLIVYSSRDGQTRKIAGHIADRLGGTCDLVDLADSEKTPVNDYQRVLIGAAIRYGHHAAGLKPFIDRNLAWLNRVPSAFFSVNLTARKPEKRSPETNAYSRKFLASTPWRPDRCAVFAGALRYPQYPWYDRIMIQLIMRMTGGETDSSKEIEYTDWHQVDAFADDFAALLNKTPVA